MQWLRDMIAMIRDLRAEIPRVGRWGFLLNAPMWLGGLIFIQRPEAAATFVLNTIAVAIAAQIHKRSRFSRLTSICHIAWLPVIPWLVAALLQPDAPTVYRGWLFYTVATMGISLILDVRNLLLYWGGGDREFAHGDALNPGA